MQRAGRDQVKLSELKYKFRSDLTKIRELPDLPANARRYVDRVSELVGLPVSIISVGPDREQTIYC